MVKTIKVLSLGAGVQSSALCYMYEKGDMKYPPDFAVFADTQAEPRGVYSFFRKLRREITKFPIYTATAGDLKKVPGKIPFFLKGENGEVGMNGRQCTKDYKINAVNKMIRNVTGHLPRERWKIHVEIVMGISFDERSRCRESVEAWRTFKYPLVDDAITRDECLDYCQEMGIFPPRSACIMCPYRKKHEWARMKRESPKDFKKACEYDDLLRSENNFSHRLIRPQYISRELIPLRELDFSTPDSPQVEMKFGMENECEGMCGV